VADDSMRLSVSAARNDEPVINIVLTAAASVRGSMDFIFIFSIGLWRCWFLTLEAI
jgi:hypothetical protein